MSAADKMTKINIVTIFPDLIRSQLNFPPFKKAISSKIIDVNIINIRDFSTNSYKSVDDKSYGGGVGMIMSIEPIYSSLKTNNIKKSKNSPIILLSPKGITYNQNYAKKLAKMREITFICGRYEGVDARVENLCTDTVSLGNFILSGGENAAIAILESVVRLLPGVLEKKSAIIEESFENDTLEYPQYTRPEKFKNWKVPKILLSGDHEKIKRWREEHSIKLKENG